MTKNIASTFLVGFLSDSVEICARSPKGTLMRAGIDLELKKERERKKPLSNEKGFHPLKVVIVLEL